jgi:hypothetical protein
MDAREKLIELAERCEAASGPDRDLADDILRACGFVQMEKRRTNGGYQQKWKMPDGRHQQISFDPTKSLDAAMTLVPENCLFIARTLWDGPIVAGYASVSRYSDDADECDGKRYRDDYPECAATPALALCAAALRARAAMDEKQP